MKNLLIAGVAKSGKSTICGKICEEEKYNHIPFDYITASMKRNYPEWGVKSDVIINDTSKILCTLFKTIADIINDTDEKFIIDCAHIYPHDIANKLDLNKWKIIFVGYPNIDVDEKVKNIRKYDINGWTTKKSDGELKAIINKLKEISNIIKQECDKYNFTFIDTSNNFEYVINNISL